MRKKEPKTLDQNDNNSLTQKHFVLLKSSASNIHYKYSLHYTMYDLINFEKLYFKPRSK